MKNLKIPCDNCLLIPVCRYKRYTRMTIDCSTIFDFLYKPVLQMKPDFKKRIKGIHEVIHPVRWEPSRHSTMGVISVIPYEG